DAVQRIEGFTLPGDLVVDPCMGVGTTGLAARTLGRRFWGCDVEEHCVNETLRRLSEVSRSEVG
ncbi:MAG: DNA methyltransferase, partial [Desulfomonilaceae bacterium]